MGNEIDARLKWVCLGSEIRHRKFAFPHSGPCEAPLSGKDLQMFKKSLPAAAWLGCLVSASAEFVVPEFDAAKASFSYSGDMNLDGGPGSLDVSQFELRALLSKPIRPVEGLTILPVFEYKATGLDFSGTPAGFPIGDEELHSINLSAFVLSSCQGSPWIYGAWGRAEMATDFQAVGKDDFTFDLAGGVGYRFNDRFLFGIGGATTNINGDVAFYPGIGFDWAVCDMVRIGLYGPTFIASFTPDTNWEFSVRGESGGDIWNIRDTAGKSRSIDLTTYRVGLFASRRLTGELWLTGGVGATVGNEIRLTNPNGDHAFKRDLNSGAFGQIGLRLTTW